MVGAWRAYRDLQEHGRCGVGFFLGSAQFVMGGLKLLVAFSQGCIGQLGGGHLLSELALGLDLLVEIDFVIADQGPDHDAYHDRTKTPHHGPHVGQAQGHGQSQNTLRFSQPVANDA